MSETFTYVQLTTALTEWVEERSSEYLSNLDRIIKRGELKLLRDLDLSIFDLETDKNTSNGSEELDKPDNIVVARTLSYDPGGGATRAFLRERSLDFVRDYGGSGNPLYYAEKSATKYALAPVPTSTIAIKILHIVRPASLVTDTNGTILSLRFADALFYACILSAEEFLQNDERLPVWRKRYEGEILPAAKLEAMKMTRAEYGR